jgi:hypothetical protein
MEKIWEESSATNIPFILGVPENGRGFGFEVEIVWHNGEFSKRSVKNENVDRSK